MQKKFITLLLALLGFSMVIEAKSINTYGFTIGAGQTREFYIYMNTVSLPCPDTSHILRELKPLLVVVWNTLLPY